MSAATELTSEIRTCDVGNRARVRRSRQFHRFRRRKGSSKEFGSATRRSAYSSETLVPSGTVPHQRRRKQSEQVVGDPADYGPFEIDVGEARNRRRRSLRARRTPKTDVGNYLN